MDRRTFTKLLLLTPLGACVTARELSAPALGSLSLRMNFEGAEALLAVLEQSSVTDADIDRLLSIRGVQAMVDNTTKYIPRDTREVFRAAVKEFVSTRKSTLGHFRLDTAAEQAAEVRKMIAGFKADQNLQAHVVGPLLRYLPPLEPLSVTVYCLVGGVSDGFVPDDEDTPAFYMGIDRAQGDVDGAKLNMTHELYHVAQRTARARVPGLSARIFNEGTAPDPVRLMTLVQEEGAATYVAAPALERGAGPYIEMWRASYRKNAPAEQIVANFALFDRTLAELRSGAMTWEAASKILYTGYGPGLYFVGYEMTKAIDRRYGPERIGPSFQQHPAAFFRAYVDLCRERPAEVPARFSEATEAYIISLERG
jgi:hypothetical protein